MQMRWSRASVAVHPHSVALHDAASLRRYVTDVMSLQMHWRHLTTSLWRYVSDVKFLTTCF